MIARISKKSRPVRQAAKALYEQGIGDPMTEETGEALYEEGDTYSAESLYVSQQTGL